MQRRLNLSCQLFMKKIFAVILVFLFVLPSCKKEKSNADALLGSWRLIEFYNDSLQVPRPVDANRDFIITFENTNTFAGQTFRNIFSEGSYTLSNTNQLRFGSYNTTKIAEDAWGNSFNTVLISCILQSVSPCTPSIIHIENGKLTVTTPFHDTLLL